MNKEHLHQKLKDLILKVLLRDPKPMPLQILMYKVFTKVKSLDSTIPFVEKEHFMEALNELMSTHLVGKNQYEKYFIDYLDYEEKPAFGQGYLELDQVTGNGFITDKKDLNEYKKSAYFCHKKNLNGAKHGDYVRFCELKVSDKARFTKFSLIDVKIKEILNRSSQ